MTPKSGKDAAERRRIVIAVLAGSVATVLMLSNFNFGFRPTADQMEYTYAAMTQTPADWLRFGMEMARYQGRIALSFIMPLQIMGGLIGDMWFYPFLCIGILAAIVCGFAVWLQMLTQSPIAIGFVIIYMALLPVGLNHWLPNSYPILFLPLAIAMLCKAVLLRFSWLRLPLKMTLAVVIFVAAISFETALTLLAIMAAVEAILYLQQPKGEGQLSRSYVEWQVAIVVLGVSVFLGYRFFYPSTYEGNQLPIDPVLDQVFSTGLHLYYATSIDTLRQADWSNVFEVQRVVKAMLVACGAGIAIYLCPPKLRHWPLLATIGVVIAFATTVPISVNHKYIHWCFHGDTICSYIDARFSLLGIASVILSLYAIGAKLRWFRRAFATLIGCIGAVTFLADANGSQNLQWISSGERIAKAYVCKGDATTVAKDEIVQQLAALPIEFHPERDGAYKARYWSSYIEHLRYGGFWNCP